MTSCIIENGMVTLDGEVFFAEKETSFADFSKKALKIFCVDYPKFFKIDKLSKLAFLASELILRHYSQEEKNKIALLFANKSASLDIDLKHQHSISDKENYYPSPAVFVYTLPNICLGEISIYHQMKTENAFFVFDNYPHNFFENYSKILLKNHATDRVLCGWVEFLNNNYKADLRLIQNEN
ncbi:MAG: 3-oxoacyl-ACP synthase [Capnocytophaga sp.]|nr:3-oxoacyl-ACP synthase [Capnocytophaga sp.]